MKIIVYPVGENPYQKLLYDEIEKSKDVTIKYLTNTLIDKHAFIIGMPIFPIRFLLLRLQGYHIIHLHWLSPFNLPSKSSLLKQISSLYLLCFLVWTKLIGFKLVWTMHEVMPHEKEFSDDIASRKLVTKLADAVIAHTIYAVEEAKALGFNMEKVHIIAHGNYTAAYRNTISKLDARKKLGLEKDDFVFLFFGNIKKYKGIDDLLFAFKKLIESRQERNIKLIIAGKCEEKKLMNLMNKFKKEYNNEIILNIKYVSDNDVQIYLNACDIITLPFKRNTTSGSALLALTFVRPIIAPLIGSIKDLPKNMGIFYNPSSKNALFNSMEKSLALARILQVNITKNDPFKSNSWQKIAETTRGCLFNYIIILI